MIVFGLLLFFWCYVLVCCVGVVIRVFGLFVRFLVDSLSLDVLLFCVLFTLVVCLA